MSITNSGILFSIAGFIFGLAGFLISLRSIFRERPKLEVRFIDDCNIIDKRRPQSQEYQALFKVLLINKSSLPITVFKISRNENDFRLNKSSKHPKETYEGYMGDGIHTIYIGESIDVPLTIDSFGAIEGYVYFYNFPHTNKGEKVKLYFHTANKVFEFDTKIDSSTTFY